ncbi:hypothetical protein BKA69DRAFT_1108089 [Paraphysoderma sedebokerense]|nr:hypothetical protein BKA69DRAFT_1108089 [Paraphysoderma sedebokerense]
MAGSQVDVDMAVTPSTANISTIKVDDLDMADPLDDEYEPPAHLENQSATVVSALELAGSAPSIAHESTSIRSSLTTESNPFVGQLLGTINDDSVMDSQLPIDGIYHRYLSHDQFESCYCYTGYNAIVMWDHHVVQNETFQLNRSEIRIVSYGRTYFRDEDIVWISCDCEAEESSVFRTHLKADLTLESIDGEEDRIGSCGSCTHAQLALRIITMTSPFLLTHEDFRKLFNSKTNSTAPISIDLKVLRKNSMKPIHLHFYEPEKLWVASYADQYCRFKHVSCSRTNKMVVYPGMNTARTT